MDTKLLFEKAKEAGISEIEVYRQKNTHSEIGIFNHQVETLNSNSTNVCYIRGAYNGHLGSVYVENNNLSVEDLYMLINNSDKLNQSEKDSFYNYELFFRSDSCKISSTSA